jgi:hypothetical protein
LVVRQAHPSGQRVSGFEGTHAGSRFVHCVKQNAGGSGVRRDFNEHRGRHSRGAVGIRVSHGHHTAGSFVSGLSATHRRADETRHATTAGDSVEAEFDEGGACHRGRAGGALDRVGIAGIAQRGCHRPYACDRSPDRTQVVD